MKAWPVQDAKARFSEMLETCLTEGPQLVTRRGEETAVLVSRTEWDALQKKEAFSIKDWLMTDFARGDLNIPERGSWNSRPAPEFD